MTRETTPHEVKAAIDRLGRTFHDFKQNHAGNHADPLVEQKLDRLGSEMSRLEKQLRGLHAAAARPAIGGAASPVAVEHKAAFLDGYVRKGREREIGDLETKALNVGTPSEGGYAVPEELDRQIERRLREISPIRAIASVVQIGSSNYKKLITVSGPSSGWVGETAPRPETDAPDFAEVAPPLGEIFANPAATQMMLDDAFFDVEAWLAEELASEFAIMEGSAFVNGNGVDKPKGFLTLPTAATADAARPFGTLQHVATGVNGNFAAAAPSDVLFDLIHSLKAGYRAGARFVMNSATLNVIRKFKDADGDYLWKPGLAEGQASTLLGFPVVEAEDMPAITANSLSVAFGNFERGYLITDRLGTRVLRDPYSNKPFVHFYTTRRVGGGVINSDALKLLKFATA